jgi:pyruvate/2-oxoglutarate dehydrogenase complex dihydrolipoamide dehydrogenase (E3) component
MTPEETIAQAAPAVPPPDEYNRQLLANAHPSGWTNPEPRERYNLVVLGAGTAGLVTAAGAAGLGARVALVERHLLGGDCLNYGCVPSKALIRCSRAYADVREAGDYGVQVPAGARVDFPRVMQRMRRLRARISENDSAQRFRGLGVDVYLGDARFTGPETIEVGGRTLRFARAVIATGARPSAPPLPGLAEAGYLTNETVFSLTELPPRLAIIGAGPIGCELAQAFARFGSQVHLLEAEKQILVREDPDAARVVEAALAREGVKVVCGSKGAQVRREAAEKIIAVECGSQKHELRVDSILVGTGRSPNVEGLNLESAGVEYDRKVGVKVDDYLQTTNPRIYAAGDVCFPYKFTHLADALARVAIQNALFFKSARTSSLKIPWCTYTDPEIAHVGLYEKEARERGIPVESVTVPLSEVDRAVLDGEEEGLFKVHVGKKGGRVLGATLVSRHAGEAISEVTAVMNAGAKLKTLGRTIHPYPTQAEAIKKAADAYNRGRLTPFVKRVLAWWLARRR